MPAFDPIVAEYRYFIADFLTNSVIAELPFTGVSYERALNGAGSFSGKIPVIDATSIYSLYENTMPGKTSLYVVRNNECVWGGIIWNRSYSLTGRELDITATEFTSYLHHRNVWKTMRYSYTAGFSSFMGTTPPVGHVTITLDSGQSYAFAANMPLRLSFTSNGNLSYTGIWKISGAYSITSTSFTAYPDNTYNEPDISIPAGLSGTTSAGTGVTVTVQVDTYDYIRTLLTQALDDFLSIDFPNDEIEPAAKSIGTVTFKQLTSNYATLTVPGHAVLPGQVIEVKNVDSTFNGRYEVTSTTASTITYYKVASNVALTAVSPYTRSIDLKIGSAPNDTLWPVALNYARLRTTTAHGLAVGTLVTISSVDNTLGTETIFNGTFPVASIISSTEFTYYTGSGTLVEPAALGVFTIPLGVLTVTPSVVYGTYGPYPGNADFGLDFSTTSYSGKKHIADKTARGFELKSVGEILDEYSDILNGFEYRIDCSYDSVTSSFKRTFVFIPIDVPAAVPPALTGDAQNLVFEYPGNIMDVSIDESAENAATRFFVVGNDGNLGQDASQPYAVATATDFLAQGWPLLDVDIAKTDTYDEASDQRVPAYDEDVLYKHAERYLSEFRPPVIDMSVSVNGSVYPFVGSYNPGDWCALIIDDPFVLERLATGIEPTTDLLVRKIEGFSVSVPDNPSFPEKVSLRLIPEWEIMNIGL